MKKMKQSILFGIICVSLIGLIFLMFYNGRTTHKQESKSKVQYETKGERLKGAIPMVIGERNQFVVAPLGTGVTQNYLVDRKYVSRVNEDIPTRKESGVEYKIITYAIDDNFARKEYDVYQAAEEYKKGAKVFKYMDALTYNGQDLAIITLVKDDAKKVLDEYVGMDLSNGKIVSLPEELQAFYNNPEPQGRYYEYYREPFIQTTLNSLLDQYNLFSRVSISYLESDSSQADSNASKSLNLFTEYASQSLWNRIYEEPAYAIYPRPESVSVEEWFNTSLHWFAPAGGEDLTVYAISNGQATDYPIRSYADYEAWKATQSGE